MTGSIFLGAAEYSVGEREQFVTITIRRSGDTSGPVTVSYATNPGTATQGSDYTDSDATIVIPAGAEAVTITVPILNDALGEPTERFNLSLISVDSGALLFPRTANIAILDDETPAPEPVDPPLTSPYTVTSTSIVTGLVDPMAVEWIPGSTTKAFLAEKGGRIKIIDTATNTQSVMLDIRDKVNSNADRGLMDIALHPDFEANPYIYLFYVVDPPGSLTATGGQAREAEGNRYAHLVRYEVDLSGASPTIVPGSEVVLLGNAGQSFADISGNGMLNFTNPAYSANRASDIDPVTGQFKENYLKVDSQSHVGGAIAFGPDGALYVSTGDGTSFNYADPRTPNVQSIDSLSGKILRIDPITGLGLADNPFAEANLATNQSKVYQLGLRNPYSMTFADDGRLFISETGWYTYEEINSGPAGANFGWPFYEGGDDGRLTRTPGYQTLLGASDFYNQVAAGQIVITPAFRAFSHVDSEPGYQFSAIVGASEIYTGTKYPTAFLNNYFFTDIVDGEIFAVDINDRTRTQFVTDVGEFGPVNFVQSPDGYIYMVDIANGRLARLDITDPNPPANAPPVVANPIADRSTAEDAAFTFALPGNVFSDADDPQLVLSATLSNGAPLPAWLTFNPATGTFSGTPADSGVGTHQISVTATDPDGASVSDVFALSVTNVNDAPIVTQAIAEQKAIPGVPYTLTLPPGTFSDADGDALALTARLANGAALPAWLGFDAANRTLTGTPPAGTSGTLVVALRAQDPSGAAVTDYFALSVAQDNPAPIVDNPIENQTATTGTPFAFSVPMDTFADDGALTLSAKLSNGRPLPSWLTFDAATGTFQGTPPTGATGRVNVSVTATDALGATASDSFVIRVAAGTNTNNPPVVANPVADQTTAEEALLNFALPSNTFSDPDGNALTRTATLASGAALPAWLTFNAATGVFSGRPDDAQVGTISVRVTASDPSGSAVSDTFDLTVTPFNDAPTLAAPIADRSATQGAAFSFVLPANTFADVDNPTLALSATLAGGAALPSWLTFNAATRTFSGTPGAANVGAVDIAVTATDAGGKTAGDIFKVTVGAAPTGETLYTNNPAVNQNITATGANDVFVVGSASSGYQWGPTQDGMGVVLWNSAGFDVLFGFETIRFTNKSVALASQGGPNYLDDPDLVQHLTGRSANDTFIVDGQSTAYGWGPTQAGTGIVIWTVSTTDNTYDVLTGFENIQFLNTTVSLTGLLV